MDILRLYQDYNIPIAEQGSKHYTQGWINTHCPFCEGSENYHLGYSINNEFFCCYRCGWHAPKEVLIKLLNINERQVTEIKKQYGLIFGVTKQEPKIRFNTKPHELPSGTIPLNKNHKRYLEGRGFDPEQLEREWRLIGTGPISILKGNDNKIMNYKFRIIIPYIWEGQQVSFDSRDITGKAGIKYMACPLERERIPHKDILYGRQEEWTDTGICVEGTTDVWRFGKYSFATSGIKYTPKQVRCIAKTFKRVFVCFDGGESQALKQANALVAELSFRGVEAKRIDIEGDPGGMDQSEANYLVKNLMK